jgi:hypothetical protein
VWALIHVGFAPPLNLSLPRATPQDRILDPAPSERTIRSPERDLRDGAVGFVRRSKLRLSLADMARDAVRGQFDGASAYMAVEVRDDDGHVLQVKLSFEVDKRTGHARGMIRRNVND